MLGYSLSMADGSTEVIEASAYEVLENGDAQFVLDGDVVAEYRAGQWVVVRDIGVRLARSWPDERLDDLIRTAGEILIVRHGHGAYHLGQRSKYASEALNELDALTAALLSSARIDADSRDDEAEIREVRAAVAAVFNVRVPLDPPVPSPQATRLHCPICGDRLLRQAKGLVCPSNETGVPFDERLVIAINLHLESVPATERVERARAGTSEFWYCPEDGFRLGMSDNSPQICFSCHRTLQPEFVGLLRALPIHGPFRRVS